MANTNTKSWTQWNDERTEAKLRDVASDLAAQVDRGEITADEANANYERTAARWMAEV